MLAQQVTCPGAPVAVTAIHDDLTVPVPGQFAYSLLQFLDIHANGFNEMPEAGHFPCGTIEFFLAAHIQEHNSRVASSRLQSSRRLISLNRMEDFLTNGILQDSHFPGPL